MANHPNRNLVYGHILPAKRTVSPTYWRRVVLSSEAAKALSSHLCGDDRAAADRSRVDGDHPGTVRGGPGGRRAEPEADHGADPRHEPGRR
mgnify:CR=1 FL=1